ncbi:uncharacterized protein [Dermacentor andersoni]|uniref:uncharacterized protein n=1 Tax=Dermacentor andersoni TaxID=34620 RepID=UPI0021551F0D|nr:uncharacterized protein LOC126529878 [Dermacentor andersoni]
MTDGQIRKGGSRNLLKHILDGANTKTSQRDAMSKLLYDACKTETPDELIARLTAKYLPVADAAAPKNATSQYSGRPNTELDVDFTTEVIIQALRDLNSRSAPGPDKITNKTLHNLDEGGAKQLTAIVNETWRSGKVPIEWKTAKTVFIPKPGLDDIPTLLNLAMIGLSRQLTRIENLQHTFYTDDVTMWVTRGSERQIEHTLQDAIRTTEEYLKPTGLRC